MSKRNTFLPPANMLRVYEKESDKKIKAVSKAKNVPKAAAIARTVAALKPEKIVKQTDLAIGDKRKRDADEAVKSKKKK